MIQIGVHAENWQEAIRKGAELLIQANKVQPTYVEAMITNIEKLGPYIIIAPQVAMPHARPEDGVREIGISITLLDSPVSFGEDEAQQVKLIICLAATDQTTHIEVLKSIAEVISDVDKLKRMMEANSAEEIIQLLEEEGQ